VNFRWGDRGQSSNEQSAEADTAVFPTLDLGLSLLSAAGFPDYTNYTRDFKGALDYIFVDRDAFQVVRIAPFPVVSTLSAQTALPSEHFPSDHIAVAVDIKYL
jgi:mRNA deadenylase 3'-5' endonuclease subunit Ccr4